MGSSKPLSYNNNGLYFDTTFLRKFPPILWIQKIGEFICQKNNNNFNCIGKKNDKIFSFFPPLDCENSPQSAALLDLEGLPRRQFFLDFKQCLITNDTFFFNA